MQEVFESIITSSSPDSLIESFIISDLKQYTNYNPFDSQHEVKVLLDYYKDSLAYAKSSLCLSLSKQTSFFALSNKLILSGTIQKPHSPLPSLLSEINSLDSLFNQSDISSITDYFTKHYFQNLRLYNFIFSSRENTETAHIKALIDDPLPTAPLSKSVQRVKNRLAFEEEQENRLQPSRSKVLKRTAESKEHMNEQNYQDEDVEEAVVDPVVDSVNKFHGEIYSEIAKHEASIDQEIDELKKKFR